ncbi:MAG: hypothetical protein HN597_03680 [Desulfobacula sp.]|jgi:hypothetical protein|uniref:hypothetical protein n=1 Tax=Desulfobacula sp. TaxID=2593537 RepID=UPI0039B960EF|nr:hypothetical protein [Desulfobacula sp.]
MIQKPVTVNLNANTYVPVKIPAGPDRAINVSISDGSAWYLAVSPDGEGEVTIPADSTFSQDQLRFIGELLFYAKASAGSPIMQIIWR